MEFSQADYLTGIGKKSFVAELMPKHPLYSSFLTPEAQAVIGKPHPHTVPAMRMLESEGFRYEGYVDIFDAGPTVECDVDDVNAVARSGVFKVVISEMVPAADAVVQLVSNVGLSNYRATLIAAAPVGDTLSISSEAATALGVVAGDEVRAVPLSVSDRH
jgi:arginine N-succinyltransferase